MLLDAGGGTHSPDCGGISRASRLRVMGAPLSIEKWRSTALGTSFTNSHSTSNAPPQRSSSSQHPNRRDSSTGVAMRAMPQKWPVRFTEKKR